MTQINEKLNRFIKLLNEIFELDKADLDFGIYRIMNIRKEEIHKFLSEGLPKKIAETLEPFATDTSAITSRIAEIERQCDEVGIEVSKSKMADEYALLKAQEAAGVDLSAIETDIYSALYNFFNRYYDEGDFISKRRYKEGVYAIPYEGEEVKLHWANADQYYIKTTENFRDYTFVSQGKKVHFKLVEATTEKNNNKENDTGKRVFMFVGAISTSPEPSADFPSDRGVDAKQTGCGIKTIEETDDELYIYFIYDIPEDKKRKYTEDNITTITETIQQNFPRWNHILASANMKKDDVSILQKHLNAYVAKNTFDYFIHKDLRKFLSRELDFFIKSEVIHLDDIDTTDEKRADSYIAKVRAIKRVGKIIIDFLAQIEDFQKKLWLKKKFVVETNWCITLDRIDETFYPEIIANKNQIKEWIEMYAINEIKTDTISVGYSDPLTMDFLKQNQNLVLDTKHFSADFKDKLVASIDNLDEQTGGLMIHSENFQALGLVMERYRGQVKCVYIDPPYNTSDNSFLYKNGYKFSSWSTMMFDRCNLIKSFLVENGVFCCAIDDLEHPSLEHILDSVFGIDNRLGNLVIEIKPSGRTNDKYLATSHEYIVFYNISNVANINFFPLSDEQVAQYKNGEGENAYKWRDFMRTGGLSTPEERPNSFYPIYFNLQTNEITLEKINNFIEILPIDTLGKSRVWRKTKPSFLDHLSKGEIKIENKRGQSEFKVRIIDRIKSGVRPKSVWVGSRYDAATYGTKWIKDIFGDSSPFSFPKSIHAVEDTIFMNSDGNESDIILDVFAGSGTTGEAVLRLNNKEEEKDGTRKYILVEMGEYFHTVTLPRMKKVIYSTDWKNGKPENRNTGISHVLKYLSLESYEDTLSNIAFSDERHQLSLKFGDEYLINYMLDFESEESLLSVDAFKMPFDYRLKINETNVTRERVIDLCETFNYLIGLSVIRQSAKQFFSANIDPDGDYEGAVTLTPNTPSASHPPLCRGELHGFRQIEGRLPDGRRSLILWRTISDDLLLSNAALDAYFTKNRINPLDREYDVIYVNGDSNLENLRMEDESWKVQRIEPIFKAKMFSGEE
jgi:adenine-specific DNA-methyltransferase